MEQAHAMCKEHTKWSKDKQKTLTIITTLILIIIKTKWYKYNKDKIVNNGNSDDNNRNKENKNNSRKIITCFKSPSNTKINVLGLENGILPLLSTLG